MTSRFVLAIAALACAAGCTHMQLENSTVRVIGTVTDIHQRAVLANLAMFSKYPQALPNHISLADGVVQINDEVGLGNAGGLTTRGPFDLGIDRYGPFGSRQVIEQWGSDAVGDPQDLKALQDMYRVALGLPPLPDPPSIAYLKRTSFDGSGGGGSGSPPSTASEGVGLGLTSPSGGSSGGTQKVPVEILLRDVPPPGWFGVGGKHDVPKGACVVGRYEDRYAWVTAAGVPALSRFTLSVLNIVQFEAGGARGGGKSSLAVTGG